AQLPQRLVAAVAHAQLPQRLVAAVAHARLPQRLVAAAPCAPPTQLAVPRVHCLSGWSPGRAGAADSTLPRRARSEALAVAPVAVSVAVAKFGESARFAA